MRKPRQPIGKAKILWPKLPHVWIEDRVLYVSIPFTWHLPYVKEWTSIPSMMWDRIVVGGPAAYIMPEYLEGIPNMTIERSYPGVLQKVHPEATRSTISCPRKCKFCAVKTIDGPIYKELDDWPALPIMIDNNITAASKAHFIKVIDKLLDAGYSWIDFNQGVDARLLKPWHVEQIARVKKPTVRLALDSMDYADKWANAVQMLLDVGIHNNHLRSYALIGFDTGPEEAWERCHFIKNHGVYPMPMFYARLDALEERVITEEQLELGWTHEERVRITGYFYRGRFKGEREYIKEDIKRRSYWFLDDNKERTLPL